MLKRMIGLLLTVLLLIFGTGCLAPSEIDSYGYVISLGVDHGNEKKFYFTFMLQRESGESANGGEGGAVIIAEEGNDLFDAVNSLEGRIPYVLDFSRMNFVLFGEQAAKDGSIEEFASYELESLLVRMSAVVMICEPSASRFIGGMSANNNANITKLQSAILQDKEKTGMVSVMTLSRMMEACTEGRFDFCPALGSYNSDVITDMNQKKSEEEGEDPIEEAEIGASIGGLKSAAVGSALFDGWKMKDKLSRRETMLLNLATGEFKEGTYIIKTDQGTCSLRLKADSHSSIVKSISGHGAEFEIKITLWAEPLLKNDMVGADDLYGMIEAAQARLTGELYELFDKCVNASCDAFKLGTVLSREFPTVASWEEYGWKSMYAQTKVSFSVLLKESVGGSSKR